MHWDLNLYIIRYIYDTYDKRKIIGYKINVHSNNQPKVKNYCNYNNHNNKINNELLKLLELLKL